MGAQWVVIDIICDRISEIIIAYIASFCQLLIVCGEIKSSKSVSWNQ